MPLAKLFSIPLSHVKVQTSPNIGCPYIQHLHFYAARGATRRFQRNPAASCNLRTAYYCTCAVRTQIHSSATYKKRICRLLFGATGVARIPAVDLFVTTAKAKQISTIACLPKPRYATPGQARRGLDGRDTTPHPGRYTATGHGSTTSGFEL